ncbi:MAG: endonuclease/exonuclease/phosphatase family protein [Prevotellaceae bacterium]|nr:endonuclease/exonuclease/phosphatase family protein [Prevotellaceae bacterium]
MKDKKGNPFLKVIAGANVASILAMIVVGYSYYINPASFPKLSTIGLFFPFFILINLALFVFWFFVKKKYLVIPIIGFIICAAPIRTYCPLNMPSTVHEDAIKVISYNTHSFGSKEYDENGENVVLQYLKNADADIVCLQESYGIGYPFEYLKKTLNTYEFFSGDIEEIKDNKDLFVISKYPIIKVENILVKSNKNSAVAFWLKKESDTILVVNCHLESYQFSSDEKEEYKEMLRDIRDRNFERDNIKEESKFIVRKLSNATIPRSEQAREIAAFISEHKNEKLIVCGDFNDNPISYVHHTIASELTDCFVSSGNGLGISYNEKGFYVRIDNILCSGAIKPYACKVDNKITVSDHFPMICWLKID